MSKVNSTIVFGSTSNWAGIVQTIHTFNHCPEHKALQPLRELKQLHIFLDKAKIPAFLLLQTHPTQSREKGSGEAPGTLCHHGFPTFDKEEESQNGSGWKGAERVARSHLPAQAGSSHSTGIG